VVLLIVQVLNILHVCIFYLRNHVQTFMMKKFRAKAIIQRQKFRAYFNFQSTQHFK